MSLSCNQCDTGIDAAVAKYALANFSNYLCRSCQKTITPEEEALYRRLKARGVPVILHKNDGHKTMDLAIPEALINIEIDGLQHNFSAEQALSDLKRTFYSFKKGYFTLRLPNSLIKKCNQETVTDMIVEIINESGDQIE
ncbi:MAG: DUF559 domain-containing protein [Candidatus Micrarchaeota archaeon]